MTRRKRGLSMEERTLWETVARTVDPLRRADAVAEPEPEPVPLPVVVEGPKVPSLPVKGKRPEPPARPPLHPIERRTLSRVARGTVGIDGRIDLHGLTQDDAHRTLRGFLIQAQARGAKLVLVITGKGRPETRDEIGERGILRRRVPQWLAEPALRTIVIGFEEAHRTHGGGGALYVRIRKRREAGP